MDGHGACEVLEAILQVFPLDSYTEHPVSLMQVIPGDPVETPIWDSYKGLVKKNDARGENAFTEVERSAFYEQSRSAYAFSLLTISFFHPTFPPAVRNPCPCQQRTRKPAAPM